MTDIGDYVDKNRPLLEGWGRYVSERLGEKFSSQMKIPISPRVKDPASARAKQLKKKVRQRNQWVSVAVISTYISVRRSCMESMEFPACGIKGVLLMLSDLWPDERTTIFFQ